MKLLVRVEMVLLLLVGFATPAVALIMGGGTEPVQDPGWPPGAAEIFNHTSRIAYWEGPPFGGGQYTAECRGDAKALTAVLEKFAKLGVANRRIVVDDGVGHSFWLNPNNEAEKREDTTIDWRFMVWVPENWERLKKLPPDLNPTNAADNPDGPPTEIRVFADGNVDWAAVVVPEGIEVIDNRREARGFTKDDGMVLEGTIVDLATGEPIVGSVELQEISASEAGGYDYATKHEAGTDATGNWTITNAPAGWFQVVAMAEGYVPRIAGYLKTDGEARWHSYAAKLAKPGEVTGVVTSEKGEPLSGVKVSLSDVSPGGDGRYRSPQEFSAMTDATGEFAIATAPIGPAKIRVHKQGYTGPGLGKAIKVPAQCLELTMSAAAEVKVIVLFVTDEIPSDYMVNIEPEGGAVVGSWGGSAKIDEQNQVVFENIPPGKYVVVGHPNPHTVTEKTPPLTVELTGGESETVTIKAR